MSDRRRWRLDLVAAGLLLSGLTTALAIFSHDPSQSTANLLGPLGQAVASQLDATLGQAVYILLACWFVVVILLFLRRNVWTWLRRLAGWLLLLPCAAVAAERFGPGTGGSVGVWLLDWLQQSVDRVGQLALGSVAALLGVGLALDFVLLGLASAGWRSARWSLCTSWVVLRWLVRPAKPKAPKPFPPKKPAAAPKPVEPAPAPAPAEPESPADIIPIHRNDAAGTALILRK